MKIVVCQQFPNIYKVDPDHLLRHDIRIVHHRSDRVQNENAVLPEVYQLRQQRSHKEVLPVFHAHLQQYYPNETEAG